MCDNTGHNEERFACCDVNYWNWKSRIRRYQTSILFSEAEKVDFSQLHQDVCAARIHDIDHDAHFMAMDADFTERSFSYTPLLVLVHGFDNNKAIPVHPRRRGRTAPLQSKPRDLNPAWFKKVFDYIENRIPIEPTGYDLSITTRTTSQ
ncbi:MAG: hypothetical protein IPL70_16030 [Uliginosibacterium sp.]|nr:hypothetical protein [Uliginosibacterium sp.]